MCFSPQRRAIFQHLNFKKWSETLSFLTFWLGNLLLATAACNFWLLLWPRDSAPAALTSLLFDSPDTRIIGKTQRFATSLTFGAHAFSFFWLSRYCIFFLLTLLHLLTLLSSDFTSSICFSSAFQLSILSEVYYLNFLRLHSTTTHYSSTTLYYKVLLQYYAVLQSTTPVLLCTTPVLLQYYSVTTLYYTVLQRTTPVLLCTTKYCSSTTLYYKVLLQYYSVLQSIAQVLLCTTKYYSSTSLYYKVLLQYYSVLQSNTHDWSLSHMNRYLHCAEQQESASNFTKYCTCHAKWLWWLIRVT